MQNIKKIISLIVLACFLNLALPTVMAAPNITKTPEEAKVEGKLKELRKGDLDIIKGSKRLKEGDTPIDPNFVESDLEYEVLPNILNIVFKFSGIIIMIIFFYAGTRLIFGYGDEESLNELKNIIIYTIIGGGVIMASLAVVSAIIAFFTSLNV
jgi:hypothetical protein